MSVSVCVSTRMPCLSFDYNALCSVARLWDVSARYAVYCHEFIVCHIVVVALIVVVVNTHTELCVDVGTRLGGCCCC